MTFFFNCIFSKWRSLLYSLALGESVLFAHEPYQATVEVGAATTHVSAPNLIDLGHDLSTTALESAIPSYTPLLPVTIKFDLRGLTAFTSFPAGSATLEVVIPQAGIATSFTGSTREDSYILFKAFIKEGVSLPRLLRNYSLYSPIDPIAGNPNSLMAQMAEADHRIGRLSPFSYSSCCWQTQPIEHQFQAGIIPMRTFTRGFDTTSITLPLRYSYSPDFNWALILDAPLTYNRNGGASSLLGSVAAGMRFPINTNWALTPILRAGIGGSLDLCTAGSFVSGALTSECHTEWPFYLLSMVNSISLMTSTNFWLTGVNFNYHLHNAVVKNRLSLICYEIATFCRHPLHLTISFEDSLFAGSRLFLRHFDEFALELLTSSINPTLEYDSLAMRFSYQWGQCSYKGYSLGATYQF